jgi:hypothetical protein
MEKAISFITALSYAREAAVKFVYVNGLTALLSLMDTHTNNLELLQAAQVRCRW